MTKNKCHFDLVTVLPGLVLGPHLNGGISQSHKMVLAFIDGMYRMHSYHIAGVLHARIDKLT